MMRIAIDAMGGDHAPEAIVAGVLQARDQFNDVEFLLYGQAAAVTPLVTDSTRITIIDAPEVIRMEDEPVKAVRRKKQSSLVLAATAVKDGEAEAVFSAGNTGALLAAGLFIVGRIKGIDRPGLTTTLPVLQKPDQSQFVMLDVGANADTKPFNMVQYAVLGQYYAQSVMGVTTPRIGLLNNGTEADKGDKAHQAVYQALSTLPDLNFVGNVEARDLLNGPADVVVTDGFTGNATLKAIEGTALSMLKLMKTSIMTGPVWGKLGAGLLRGTFTDMRSAMDYSQYGGAVLMGVQAPVVKAHGASKADTITNTIAQIRTMLQDAHYQEVVTYFETHAEEMMALKESMPS